MSRTECFIRLQKVDVLFHVPLHSHRVEQSRALLGHVGGRTRSRFGMVDIFALQNVSFQIEAGERVAIMGHNGSGKTTLLRTILGVYQPAVGSVSVVGNCLPLLDISLGIEPEYTARENIRLRCALLGLRPPNIQKFVEHVLSIAELGEYGDLPVRTYSTGMLMRLAFALAISAETDILVMDEWLSVGDTQFREVASNLLSSRVKSAQILVMATHDFALAQKFCTRLLRLERGQLIEDRHLR